MSLAMAVALFALLVSLFTLVVLVAVYARLRHLEAGRSMELSGYTSLLGAMAPDVVAPRDGAELSVVVVLDTACALCHSVWKDIGGLAGQLRDLPVRFIGVLDRQSDADGFTGAFGRADGSPRGELLADVTVRAELFEGYSPTLLIVNGAGRITNRSFVYGDTDVPALLLGLLTRSGEREGQKS